MFSVVIVLVSLVLVIATVGAVMYYGGGGFNDNKVKSDAAKYRNEAQQIGGAVTMFKADGNVIDESFTLQALVDGDYLSHIPEAWEPGSNRITRTLSKDDESSEHVCHYSNEQAGYKFSSSDSQVEPYSREPSKGIPHCDKENLDPNVPCCVNVSE